MASLVKPTYTVALPASPEIVTQKGKPHVRVGKSVYPLTADGTKYLKPVAKWYGKYTDGQGVVQKVPLAADKTAANLMLAELVKRADRQQRGLFDPAEDHARRPLADHLTDYEAVLEAKGDTTDHIRLTRQRIAALLDGCGFMFASDTDPARASEWLNSLRRNARPVEVPVGRSSFTPAEAAALLGVSGAGVRAAVKRHRLEATGNGRARTFPRATVEALAARAAVGTGPQTVNHYVRAVRGFFRWLVSAKRIGFNPLASLDLLNAATDVRRGRRELTADELRRVFDAARTSTRTFRGLSGSDRYALYLTAATTGFRASALANLTPSDFDPAAATITLSARFNKSRKQKVQPLPADVAAELAGYMAGKASGTPVWGGPWAKDKRGAEMIRGDLDAAGVPYSVPGPDGPLYADFHALRHSYLTLLGRNGVDLRTAQVLAGHSRPELTARYSHKSMDDLAGAVGKLPSLVSTVGAAATVPHVPPHVPTARVGSHSVARMCATGAEQVSGSGVAESLEMKRPGADSHRAALSDCPTRWC